MEQLYAVVAGHRQRRSGLLWGICIAVSYDEGLLREIAASMGNLIAKD